MKKFLTIFLALSILVLALASCNNPSQTTNNAITIAPDTTVTTSPTETTKEPVQDTTIVPSGEQFWAISDLYEVMLLRKYGSVNSCAITAYNAQSSDVVFPEYYEENKTKTHYPVIWIGSGSATVFVKGSPVSITLPSSTLAIKALAFEFNLTIESVKLNEGLETIEKMAFWCCTNLKTVNLPSTLITIEANAFQGTGIQTLVIPSSVQTIGKSAFAGCTNLTSVTLPRRFESQVNDIFGSHASSITFTYVD